jgi:hypothetical protein
MVVNHENEQVGNQFHVRRKLELRNGKGNFSECKAESIDLLQSVAARELLFGQKSVFEEVEAWRDLVLLSELPMLEVGMTSESID